MRSAERHGRLVYVVGSFPSLSETFILREMEELERRGFRLSIVSLEPGDATVHENAREFAGRTVYRPSPLSPRSLLAGLVTLLLHPFGFAGAMIFAFGSGLRTPVAFGELMRSFAAAAFFACALRGRKTKHVHAHFASMPATVGLLLAHVLETTFSFSAHARDIFTGESVLLDRKLRQAEFVAICTRAGLEQIRRQHPMSTKDRLNLIYHGVDVATLLPVSETAHAGEAPEILSVGRLVEKKGFPILLRAAAMLRQRGVDFRLRIVGSGPEEPDLRRLMSGLALEDCVHFEGSLPHEKLLPIFQGASLFVLASIVAGDGDRDGIPNVLLEALAMGVPAIGSEISAIPELIEHEETGLLARPGDPEDLADQMERLLFDEQLRAKVIDQGRRLVITRFDVRENTVKLADLFSAAMIRRR